MAPDYLKLFMDRRLTVSEPHHLEYINARLANMKFDDPIGYKEYSEFYGIEMKGEIKPVKIVKPKDEPKRKPGRPNKKAKKKS